MHKLNFNNTSTFYTKIGTIGAIAASLFLNEAHASSRTADFLGDEIPTKSSAIADAAVGDDRADPGADLRRAILKGANLRGAYLEAANLRAANLTYTNLEGANLRGANLRGADLIFANLRGANLEGANFTGAKLIGANFTGANLTEEQREYLRSICPLQTF